MSALKHINSLKEFKKEFDLKKVDNKNKIYFLEVHGSEHDGYVKIGDTHRDVTERNSETVINSALSPKQLAPNFHAEKWDGSTFRDKEFHKFLENKGYERKLNHKEGKSEWFKINLDTAINELEEFCSRPIFEEVTIRPAQQYLAEKEQQAIDEGYKLINGDYCMRSGKTIQTLIVAKENNLFPAYIGKNLTSQNSAEQDNAKYGIVPHMTTESLHGPDGEEFEDDELTDKVKNIIDNIEKKNKLNQKIAFYIDEVDDSSHTKKSCDSILPIIKYFMEKGLFGLCKTMSGTRAYRGLKILEKVSEMHKELFGTELSIKELSLAYFELQLLQPDTTVQRNFRCINFYTKKGNLTSISDALKNKDHGHKSIASCMTKILGSNNFEIKLDPEHPHWFMKFATVGKSKVNEFVNYMNRNHSIIENREFFFAPINGDFTRSKDAEKYCKDIIEKNIGKTCVFITQGMGTTSYSVIPIGNSVLFTDREITSDCVQGLHRPATWGVGKYECNMILVTTNDSTELSFDDIFEEELKIAETKKDKEEIYRMLLENNSMIHFHEAQGFAPVKITCENVEKFIDKKQKSLTRISGIVRVLMDMDETVQEKIFNTIDPKKGTSKKSKGAFADKFDPFGDNENKTTTTRSHDSLSLNRKQQMLRAFVENAIMVPAVAREQDETIDTFKSWDTLNVSKELFFDIYNSSWQFKDRIKTIYGLCSDEKYLVSEYIDKVAV